MCKIKTTEYTFEIKREITVTVFGTDTEDNYEKAMAEAIRQVKQDIDKDWLTNATAEEFTDYEMEYEEAV